MAVIHVAFKIKDSSRAVVTVLEIPFFMSFFFV